MRPSRSTKPARSHIVTSVSPASIRSSIRACSARSETRSELEAGAHLLEQSPGHAVGDRVARLDQLAGGPAAQLGHLALAVASAATAITSATDTPVSTTAPSSSRSSSTQPSPQARPKRSRIRSS